MALATPTQPAKQVVVQAEPANMSKGAPGVVPLGHASLPTPEPRASQTFTGALPVGGVDRPHLRSAFVAVPAVWWTDAPDRLHYRGHADEAVHIETDWDLAVQPAPHFEVDQRVNW